MDSYWARSNVTGNLTRVWHQYGANFHATHEQSGLNHNLERFI